MKNFNSIDAIKNYFQQHPEIEGLKLKFKAYWNLAYSSIYAVWYILAMLLGIIILSIWWFKDSIQHQIKYIAQRNQEMTAQPSTNLTHNIQLGSQRLFGEKISYSGSISTTFKLQAILYDIIPNQRIALIQDDQNVVKFYREGDTLPGGAVVKTIKENQVIIETSGDDQLLKLADYPVNFLSDKPLVAPDNFFNQTKQ